VPFTTGFGDFHHTILFRIHVPYIKKISIVSPTKIDAMKKLIFILMLPFFMPVFAQKWAKEFDFVNDNVCGLSLVKKSGKYGFVNKEGKVVVPLIYDESSTMSEGYAPIRLGEVWGYVDSNGKVTIEPTYNDALCYHDGLAAVKKNGKWGFINYEGKLDIPFSFDNARGFREGLAAVSNLKGYWGYVDKEGKLVIPYQYHFADNFTDGVAKVMKGDKTIYINKYNAVVQQ
jgi:hypothetical protein